MDLQTVFIRCALVVVLAGSIPAAAGIGDYPFRIVTRGTSADYQAVAENSGPAPITVHVSLSGRNLASDRAWPVTAVVPPHTALPLGRVYADERLGPADNARFDYSYHFGRADAVHDDAVAYRLPFEDGRGFEVSQAFGGALSTHDSDPLMHAIDFAMPAGSSVTAARAGVVVDVMLRYTEGGNDPRLVDRANTVSVAHDDGTVAEYAHLSPGPALVALGERVGAGDLLGYSGGTGYSSEPHLHFMVTRPEVSLGRVIRVAVPVLFYGRDPAVRFSAQAGTTVWANYGATIRQAALRPRRAQ